MAYYESLRAANAMGVPVAGELSDQTGWTFKGTAKIVGGERSHSSQVTRPETIEESLDRFFEKAGRKRSIATTLYDAVENTQIIDTVIDLRVGRMRFLQIPGSAHSEGGAKKNVLAFWATGLHQNSDPMFETHIVLVGSLDGLTSSTYSSEDSSYDGFNFPSDPGFMIEILNEELKLVDLEDYEYATEWTRDSPDGLAAQTAHDITNRASTGSGKSWVRATLPQQRVVAIVNDVYFQGTRSRVVLARPVLISPTI